MEVIIVIALVGIIACWYYVKSRNKQTAVEPVVESQPTVKVDEPAPQVEPVVVEPVVETVAVVAEPVVETELPAKKPRKPRKPRKPKSAAPKK